MYINDIWFSIFKIIILIACNWYITWILIAFVMNLADKVIVQSEDMKQVYIKVLLDATNDHTQAARAYWEEKILGLGSPKFHLVFDFQNHNPHSL